MKKMLGLTSTLICGGMHTPRRTKDLVDHTQPGRAITVFFILLRLPYTRTYSTVTRI
jgi:hypothetical protein